MFERLTDKARHLVVASQTCAKGLGHDYIGTEHFLLAATESESEVIIAAFARLGLTTENVREALVNLIPATTKVMPTHIAFTPRAKRVLELAQREALELKQHHKGPEHFLLAIFPDEAHRRDDENVSVAIQILEALGIDPEDFRTALLVAIAAPAAPAA